MRFSRTVINGEPAVVCEAPDGSGRRVGDASDLGELIAQNGARPSDWELGDSVTGGQRLAPLLPPKIVAIGLNYHDHASESGVEPPERPLVFAKFPSSVIGPDEAIEINPSLAERVDWEVELAVVIGKQMKGVSAEQALDYVFGYTVANDVSARDVQFGDGQWTRGKSFDTFCPLGPVVVTPDELGSPDDLKLWTTVNGETMQSDTTANLIFGVRELLAFCSASFTLDPGDVILTGTPPGCGEFMNPRRSLADGDVVETGVDGIGTLRNPVKFVG